MNGLAVLVGRPQKSRRRRGLRQTTVATLLVAFSLLVGGLGVRTAGEAVAADRVAAPVAATVPLAPTTVTALPGNRRVRVLWSRPADGGTPIVGFVIASVGDGGVHLTVAAGLQEADVTDLTNGTSYTFTVAAVNALGAGQASSPTAPVTPVDPGFAPPQRLVRALYVDFLRRLPTSVETDSYGPRLLYQPVLAVALDLASSQEWVSSLVNRLYLGVLGRAPDSAGLSHWVPLIRSGTETAATVASQLYASDEYFAQYGHSDLRTWVMDLYRKILGRDADAGGLAKWLAVNAAAGRMAVAEGLYQSPESSKKRVDVLYRQLLGRPADPAGLAVWSAALPFGGELALAATLAGSPEYFGRAQVRF
ncbi:MAG: hypothetical protein JWL70_3 [Acidimicrobiia bacterium]|nr:hypothetical protein [Acidimicrobiia bacterium]